MLSRAAGIHCSLSALDTLPTVCASYTAHCLRFIHCSSYPAHAPVFIYNALYYLLFILCPCTGLYAMLFIICSLYTDLCSPYHSVLVLLARTTSFSHFCALKPGGVFFTQNSNYRWYIELACDYGTVGWCCSEYEARRILFGPSADPFDGAFLKECDDSQVIVIHATSVAVLSADSQ